MEKYAHQLLRKRIKDRFFNRVVVNPNLIENASKLGFNPIEGKPGFFSRDGQVVDLTDSNDSFESVSRNIIFQLIQKI